MRLCGNAIAHYYIPRILHWQNNWKSTFPLVCVSIADVGPEHTNRLRIYAAYPQGWSGWLSGLGSFTHKGLK